VARHGGTQRAVRELASGKHTAHDQLRQAQALNLKLLKILSMRVTPRCKVRDLTSWHHETAVNDTPRSKRQSTPCCAKRALVLRHMPSVALVTAHWHIHASLQNSELGHCVQAALPGHVGCALCPPPAHALQADTRQQRMRRREHRRAKCRVACSSMPQDIDAGPQASSTPDQSGGMARSAPAGPCHALTAWSMWIQDQVIREAQCASRHNHFTGREPGAIE
jgi:hypothetical protein